MLARRKLHVLMVTPRYFPYMGGIETHVHEVGRLLARRDIAITLLTTMPTQFTQPLPERELIEGMHVIRVPAWPRSRDYYFAPAMYRLIKQGNWDLVHCQGCHTFVPPLAMQAARNANIPYILTFHTGGHSSNIRTMIRGIQWRLLRPYLVGASKLIGVSQFETHYFRNLLHLPEEQFTVIPNGAVLPSISDTPARQAGITLILSVGRLERYKGHHRLIAALPAVRRLYPDARLLIVGSGPYEATLRELVHYYGVDEHVEIRSIAPSDRSGMAQLMQQASLITLLSDYESHPLAVLEALALRCPVLVAQTSGLQELADQGWVRAIPVNSSPETIAQAIHQQIEDPLLPPAHLALPTWEQCADRIEDVYQMSLGETQTRSPFVFSPTSGLRSKEDEVQLSFDEEKTY